MKKRNVLKLCLSGLCLCLAFFALAGCSPQNDASQGDNSTNGETQWEDGNVDNNGWT
jgi:ABC-type oligopeptide transport system substrate-binding subunit